MAMLEVRDHAVRGRGLYTTRMVRGGETVLEEEPTLLYVPTAMCTFTCAACLRAMPGPWGWRPTFGEVQTTRHSAAEGPPQELGVRGQEKLCQKCAHDGVPRLCKRFLLQPCLSPGRDNSTALGARPARLQPVQPVLDEQDVDAGRFLAHAAELKAMAAQDAAAGMAWAALQGLQGGATEVETRIAATLLPVLQASLPIGSQLMLDVPEAADLLRREQLNSYGILEPPWVAERVAAAGAASDGDSGGGGLDERVLRGSAIYAACSLVNHECNPNVARFDAVDVPGPGNTRMRFRAMHDLPPGTEILQSYFPVTWDYDDRQEHLLTVYGFSCRCQRCQLEATWCIEPQQHDGERSAGMDEGGSSGGWETDEDAGGAGAAGASSSGMDATAPDADGASAGLPAGLQPPIIGLAACYVQPPAPGAARWKVQRLEADPGPLDPMYLQLYLLKYVCGVPGCFGTLAPQRPGSDVLECCVCGGCSSEAQFLAELEAP